MEEVKEGTIVEEREELLVSPTCGEPTLRKGHFFKPHVNGTLTNLLSPSLSLPSPTFNPQNWRLKVSFMGWRNPGRYWTKWVNLLLPQYQSVWKQAGIYEAVLSTTHEIIRNDDLVCGIVERWCPETKSFGFVWGEATITLEDVMVLGGFSVIGEPVSLPLVTTELKEIEERLSVARKEVGKSKAAKACQTHWLKKFMGSGSDIEHEAFLVFWLSRFIFPNSSGLIRSSIFSISIHLARGRRIALAPAVLAAIYSDLTVLKETIVDSVMSYTGNDGDDDLLALNFWSPFQLVQLWAWERFPEVQPVPNSLKEGDTRSARWHRVKGVKVSNARAILDSAGENFIWRPYTTFVNNWEFRKFYNEHEGWISVHSGLDEKLASLTQCMKVCQLAGLGNLEQYLPHRVAMQFGMDQDLPCDIPQTNETPEVAWSNYCKPIAKSYIPSRLFESDVTVRYLNWWKRSVLGQPDATAGVLQQNNNHNILNKIAQDSEEKERAIHVNGLTDDRSNVMERPRFCNGQDSLNSRAIGEVEDSKSQQIANGEDSMMVARPVENAIGGSETIVQGTKESTMAISAETKPARSVENAIQDKAATCGSGEATNEKAVVRSSPKNVCLNSNAGEGSTSKYQTPGLDFEARVSKVEGIFSKLKAARFR